MSDDMTPDMVEGDQTPDLADVQQREQAHPAVPVEIEGPVRVQNPPAELGSTRSLTLTTEAVRILNTDPLRTRALLWPVDGAIIIGARQSEAESGTGAQVPQSSGTPVEYRASDALWARAATGTVTLAILTEQWTR